MSRDLKNIDVVILCGGLGTRLRQEVPDRPKILARVGGKTFFDLLIEKFVFSGFKRFILCVGYLKEQVKNHVVKNYKDLQNSGIEILFSEEIEPRGTGGALKLASPLISSESFLVVNGDTLHGFDFKDFFIFHKKGGALISFALTPAVREDGGVVVVAKDNGLINFAEKEILTAGERYMNPTQKTLCGMNAGAYFMDRKVLDLLPFDNVFSLEHDFFPTIISKEKCLGFLTKGGAHDIGIPERYKEIQKIFYEPR